MKVNTGNTGNACIGLNSGHMFKDATNCTMIGYGAGSELESGDSLVYIGDDINISKEDSDILSKNNFNDSQRIAAKYKDLIFFGHRVIIGKKLFGEPNKIYYEIKKYIGDPKEISDALKDLEGIITDNI